MPSRLIFLCLSGMSRNTYLARKENELSKIFEENFNSCMIVRYELCKHPAENAENVILANILKKSFMKRLICKNLLRVVIFRKILQDSLRIMPHLESSFMNLAKFLKEMHLISPGVELSGRFSEIPLPKNEKYSLQ